MHLGGLCALLSLVVLGTAQMNTTSAPNAADSLETRYEGPMAQQFRRSHFYCLGVDQSISDFPQTYPSSDASEERSFQWAIFLQYPVLSYLDSGRKESLFRLIGELVKDGAQDNMELIDFNYENFCIAQVTHYKVSEYEESVLVNVFFNNDSVVFNPANLDGVSIDKFNIAFQNGFSAAMRGLGPNADNVTEFEGRPALIIVPENENPAVTQTEQNKHPGVLAFAEDRSKDPTFRAVFLASYPQGTTIETAFEVNIEFANNPDPINVGLEPGDIVFAVFGSLFLVVVGGLAIVGYCIHPFL